jgi:hypothetical protein
MLALPKKEMPCGEDVAKTGRIKMKTTIQLVIIIFTCGVASISFASVASQLSGVYQAIDSPGCETILGTQGRLVLSATDQGISSEVGPYSFQVGTVVTPFGPGLPGHRYQFVAGYTTTGFKVVKSYNDSPFLGFSYAGEMDMTLANNKLTIQDSLSLEGTANSPAPVSVCEMIKLQ